MSSLREHINELNLATEVIRSVHIFKMLKDEDWTRADSITFLAIGEDAMMIEEYTTDLNTIGAYCTFLIAKALNPIGLKVINSEGAYLIKLNHNQKFILKQI